MMNTDCFNGFFKNKRVLITGHTGFKGSWLSIWLHSLGAEVIGVSLDPFSNKDNYVLSEIGKVITDLRGDIRDSQFINSVFEKYHPEIVFHLAAQPLVRLSYKIPADTYEVNVMGTISIMEAIRHSDAPIVGIMITTDKCYENMETSIPYKESDPMGGYDPYSSSKGAAEIAISSWRRSFFNPKQYESHHKAIASVRAGNVIGGGDWAQDRIVPDCIRAIESECPIVLRHPDSVRPWQFVLEPLRGYLLLAVIMYDEPTRYCEGWNFGPNNQDIYSVGKVADRIVHYYGKGSITVDNTIPPLHEANLLSLDISKAQNRLKWHPLLNIEDSVRMTVEWYMNYKRGMYDFCIKQIAEYLTFL